jgi:site-specific recombinase XerD
VSSGVPLFAVGNMLGHKTASMTQRYSHLAPDALRRAFDAVASYGAPQEAEKGESDD